MSKSGGLYGELDEALRWSCGFGEHETDPPCMAGAVWHGVILNDARDLIVKDMSCCDVHVKFMRRYVWPDQVWRQRADGQWQRDVATPADIEGTPSRWVRVTA